MVVVYLGEADVKDIGQVLGCGVARNVLWSVDNISDVEDLGRQHNRGGEKGKMYAV